MPADAMLATKWARNRVAAEPGGVGVEQRNLCRRTYQTTPPMQPPAAPNRAIPTDPGDRSSPPNRPFRVALIGASIRSAAESAKSAGTAVTGLDRFADQDTRAACERHFRLDDPRFAEGGPDGAGWPIIAEIADRMPIIPVGGIVKLAPSLQRLPLLQPWPNQLAAAKKVRDLSYLHQISRDTRFCIPSFFNPGDCGRNSTQSSDPLNRSSRWLRKNLAGSGGLAIRWHDWEDAKQSDQNEILQKWVAGRAFGATLWSNGSETILLGICRSLHHRLGPLPFVYCGSVGPLSLPENLREQVTLLGCRIVETSGICGLFNIDFLADRCERVWLLEVNPRWSGSSELIERHLRYRHPGFSLFSLMIQGLYNAPLEISIRNSVSMSFDEPIWLKRIVFARRCFNFWNHVDQQKLRVDETLHDLPPAGQLIHTGEPVCTLITRCDRKEKGSMLRHRALLNHLSGGS